MNANAIYGGNYLSAATVKSEKLTGKPLTIKAVVSETFRENEKLVLSFDEIDKQLPLNKSNAQMLIEGFGSETDAWIGKQIMLLLTKRMFQGNSVDAVQLVVK